MRWTGFWICLFILLSISSAATANSFNVYSGAPNQTTPLCNSDSVNCLEGYVQNNTTNHNILLRFSQSLSPVNNSYTNQLRQLLTSSALNSMVSQCLQQCPNFTWIGNQNASQSSTWNQVTISFSTTNQLSVNASIELNNAFTSLLGQDETTVTNEDNTKWVIPVSTILGFLFVVVVVYCCYSRYWKRKLNCPDCCYCPKCCCFCGESAMC